MKIDRRRLLDLIREELVLVLPDDFATEQPDSTDAWHPSEVKPLEDAWSGGDNIDTPVDHAYVETGESNAGPHSVVVSPASRNLLVMKRGVRSTATSRAVAKIFFRTAVKVSST